LIAATALTFSGELWSQTNQSTPTKTNSQAGATKKTAAPTVKAPGWCKNAAPVVNGVATVTISTVGASKNLKLDYDRACIGPTDTVEWIWSGDQSKDWNVEFFSGANPFPKNKYGKNNKRSDRPNAPANDYKIYKYMVHVQDHNDLDPDVIIKGGRN
jgi:hypothetical protein